MILNWKCVLILAQLIAIANARQRRTEETSTIVPSSAVGTVRASYNEPCGEGIRCDSRKSLSCLNSICQCIKPSEMRYEAIQGKCIVLPGERCSYTAVDISSDTKQEKRYTEKLDCTTNAICNSDGFCDCGTNYFENAENICTPKLLEGQDCTRDNQCRSDLHLTCDSGLCSCNKTEAIFDSGRKVCVGLVGTSCEKYSCVQNAYCQYSYKFSSSGSTCSCESGYQASNDGLCKGSYGSRCSTNSPCSDGTTCIEGQCQCNYPDHQIFDTSTSKQKCVSYIRGPCKEKVGDDVKSYDCVENAICAKSSGIFECACNKGMIESMNRRCKIAYGETCEATNLCDSTAGLVCKDGKCLCGKDFEVYDFDSNKCRGLVGAKCADVEYCIDGATCDKYRDPSLKSGTCRCSPDWQTNLDRSCVDSPLANFSSKRGTDDT